MDPVIAANGDLAWMLAAFALVLLMFPGLAFYYGGMVGARNVLNVMTMVLSTLGITSVLYVLYGYGLVSGDSIGGGFIGNPIDYLGLQGFQADDGSGTTQPIYFAGWFILFAAITIAIVASGAASRMKFTAWLVFAPIWLTLVYFPMAHWVFSADGEDGFQGGFLLNDIKIHDYAGGTAVHMNSGVAALALALVIGSRKRKVERPNNVPMALLGGGILWFGWLGFNGSCALGANFLAQFVIVNSLLAGSAGMIGFCVIERIREGHVTSLGLMTGAISGLVGITPSANAMSPIGALGVGIFAGAVVAFLLSLKGKVKVDDALDAFAVHGVGGIVGTLCVVLFASESAPAGVRGILLGGDWDILWRELAGIAITCAFSFIMTYLIAKAIDKTMGLRVDDETEMEGLDPIIHAESAYEIPAAGVGHGGLTAASASRIATMDAAAPARTSTT
ncbi:ammonium transporter [Gordonia amarae]|uniref:Ammonium transporter n=2 Tax=Gordonia amarae TaxID=36821 RepID=G7GRU1_9ACTN|nr:ammonium transporter [Gordonia amarae]MCS3876986.1 Amt family ammonium transporter [Gordonia amarae]QHN15807.1 ammonium transporter [Gordonia amarae]QHN20375.1 ammonium transporter [Gordonia amarae]QHN29227.1 ammonium transporter [Gordonia amarae]QHN38006.1 ammonium transporter [Gordonia amarae]